MKNLRGLSSGPEVCLGDRSDMCMKTLILSYVYGELRVDFPLFAAVSLVLMIFGLLGRGDSTEE